MNKQIVTIDFSCITWEPEKVVVCDNNSYKDYEVSLNESKLFTFERNYYPKKHNDLNIRIDNDNIFIRISEYQENVVIELNNEIEYYIV